ncbi:hypothetical protein A8144_10525 [Mycobacterium leprae 3125609]|uniref:Rp1 n=1 Tax=Mycobacterium leprae TaxID=1769 RepID=Q49631_MYCLR|nr:hypothetical protein [Mycobacterium leprae]AAA17079.1 rp1 [Mycobacterium leprae]OAR20545.1 hypothetical protein A8144_10525 [Mycobacterium leprae 3125609]
MLTLLSEPDVLFLDESTNDVDTNTLTATEDFLISWAVTLSRITGYLLHSATEKQLTSIDRPSARLPKPDRDRG